MEFVVWLYRIGRLNSDRCMAVMDHHLMHRRPLGRVAVAQELLTEQQVASILAAQARERPRARFGELALRLGFLGIQELETLLAAQQRDVPDIATVLSRIGGVPQSEQVALMRRFRQEMAA